MIRPIGVLPSSQFREQVAVIAGDLAEADDDADSDNSIDELISEVLNRIDDYQPQQTKEMKEQQKTVKGPKSNLKKTNLFSSIMKGLEPQPESEKKTVDSMVSEQKSESSMKKFEFAPPELLEDPTLKQDWRQKNLIRDLIDDIDDKISERWLFLTQTSSPSRSERYRPRRIQSGAECFNQFITFRASY